MEMHRYENLNRRFSLSFVTSLSSVSSTAAFDVQVNKRPKTQAFALFMTKPHFALLPLKSACVLSLLFSLSRSCLASADTSSCVLGCSEDFYLVVYVPQSVRNRDQKHLRESLVGSWATRNANIVGKSDAQRNVMVGRHNSTTQRVFSSDVRAKLCAQPSHARVVTSSTSHCPNSAHLLVT